MNIQTHECTCSKKDKKKTSQTKSSYKREIYQFKKHPLFNNDYKTYFVYNHLKLEKEVKLCTRQANSHGCNKKTANVALSHEYLKSST